MSPPRVVVITGVTRGLGLAMARRFAVLGHVVAGCGRSTQAMASLQKELGAPHRFSVVDVSRDDPVAAWAADLIETMDPPDLLINNAALISPMAPLWEIARKDFDEVIDVNIKGVANVIRHFVPTMVRRKSGVIVNFSSGWGRDTDAGVAPYCASKWAIEGLTRSLAQDLPKGMAAIPVNPGIIDTDMLRSCFGDGAGQYPGADAWAEIAVPFLLGLKPSDNGNPLTVPAQIVPGDALPEDPRVRSTIEDAMRYVRWAEAGRLTDASPFATIAEHYKVAEQRVREWMALAPAVPLASGADYLPTDIIRKMKISGRQYRSRK